MTQEAATLAAGDAMFVHNMRALWRDDPSLALRVDAVPDEERIVVEETKSGAWTARMATPNGQSVYLHSRYDPAKEADRFAAPIPIEDKYCFVVSGFGLGYHIRALFERLRGDAFIVCSEPSVELIASALNSVDLADIIESGRLILLTDDDKTRLHDRLHGRHTLLMLGAQFVQHPPSLRIAEPAHKALTAAIGEFVTYTRMSLMTLVSNSRITCENIAKNLATYMSTPPIDLLRGRFAGTPGIVISAGPSLSRNLDQLEALKGRAVLCAVQTTLKPLMERGIVPDFVTSLDFHEMSRKFFEDVGDLRDVHLVAEPKATWHVIDGYPGPVSLLGNDWARQVLGDELATRGGLPAGATVAHLAFYLAVHLGCDPIIFVGQDLAYTGHVFYVPGVEIHRTWRSELNRFNSMEQKEWDRIVRNRPVLRKVPGSDGGDLYTDELLLTYLEQFEKDIRDVPALVINATEGGARIRGTTNMPLREVAKRYCGSPMDPSLFAYRKTTRWRDPSRLPETAKMLKRRIEEFDEAVTVCEELIDLLKELNKLTDQPDRFNRRLVRVDELRMKVQQDSRIYQIINSATQLAELRRFSADRRIGAGVVKGAERAKQQIQRDIDFVSAVRDGAIDVKPILTASLERVETAMATK